MRVKAIYINSLKMSEGKVASQIAHAIIGLGVDDPMCTISVLKVSRRKFGLLTAENDCYLHYDLGLSEVKAGELTAAAWVEEI